MHLYTTTFESFKATLERYHDEFGLPLIVTEYAMTVSYSLGWSRSHTQSFDPNVPPPQNQQQVHDFMGQTTAWMDATPWIECGTSVTRTLTRRRFAWFGAVRNGYNLHGVHEFNRLMDANGNVTPL